MVVFCSLFQSNTLNQLARTAHNSQTADICFEIAGLHNLPDPVVGGAIFTVKAGVNVNLSEILVSLKRG